MKAYRVLMLAVAVFIGFIGSAKCEEQSLQNADVEDLPLNSVLVRDKDVFASNADGMFRASRTEKVWTQLPLPEGMRLGGTFAVQPKNSKIVLYHTGDADAARAYEKRYHVDGQLYVSQDDGRTWREILRRPMIRMVLLQANGHLIVDDTLPYVMGVGPIQPLPVAHILESSDLGATWRDISPAPPITYVASWTESDRPDSLVVLGRLNAGNSATASEVPGSPLEPLMYLRLDSDNNQLYDATVEYMEKYHYRPVNGNWALPWDDLDVRGVRLMRSSATLSNYFGGGYESSMCSKLMYDIIPDKKAYRFSATQRKFIDVEMVLNPEAPGEHEGTGQDTEFFPIDDRGSTRFWGLSIIAPDGEYSYVPPAYDTGWATSSDQPQSKQELFKQLVDRGTLRVKRLAPEEPYVRRLDLDKMVRFDQPGTYKVSVIYESSWLWRQGFLERKEPFVGNQCGQEFEVTITESARGRGQR
ncbi:MAG TPA: hypothetical protein VF600_18290 [Abditibacteriaceae bacterium]|jgi:hypothetical protein